MITRNARPALMWLIVTRMINWNVIAALQSFCRSPWLMVRTSQPGLVSGQMIIAASGITSTEHSDETDHEVAGYVSSWL